MPTITFKEFIAYSAEALVLGSLIGAERQWRQRTAGLRTNALVALGAAAFVMVAGMTVATDRPVANHRQGRFRHWFHWRWSYFPWRTDG